MKFNKLISKTFALVLFSIATSMSATSIAPFTFGNTNTDEDNWHYLMKFKLWGSAGISLGNRDEFYDTRLYDRTINGNDYSSYNYIDPDTLGWVGTAKGNLAVVGNGGWIDGPIIVGGSITGSSSMSLITGPIRTSTGNIACTYTGTACTGTDQSESCSYDRVPEIRSNLKVPNLTGVNLSSQSSLNVSGQKVIKVDSACTGTGICDLFYNTIDFGNDSRLVVQMPEGGRPTRIFTNKLNFGTHPEIIVSYGNGNLKQNEYEGNLLIYVNSDITFMNIDNVSIMGTFISTGKISLTCNIVFAGQLIANTLEIGNGIAAKNFVFKPFLETAKYILSEDPALSFSGTDTRKLKESNTWNQINLALNAPIETDVSFNYCFRFYSAKGVSGVYAGYTANEGQIADVAAADANHKFPICNEGESEKVTIKAGDTKAAGIYIKPMIDGIVERDESLWLQISNLTGATLTSDYESEKGYRIYIVSNDKLPTVSSELTVNVNEDEKHTFTAAEFKFQHETQSFAAIFITSLPASGTLLLNGEAVKSGNLIDVSSFSKFTYTPDPNEFGNNYASFGYKVVGDGTGDNTSIEYTATVNVIPVNDKPTTQSSFSFAVNENPSKDATLGSITYSDVSNEINVDSYTFSLVSTDANYTEFSKYFVLTSSGEVKINGSQTFDYYAKKSYTVTATVTDNAATETAKINGPLTSNKFTIIINIKNENHAPTIGNQSFELPEKNKTTSGIVEWTSSKVVGNVTAKDIDGDNLTYKVIDSGIPFTFKNGTSSLVITDGSKLDYESKTSWTFKVVVSDGQAGSATANVTVNLTDVNEKPEPENVKSQYSVAENSATGTVVGEFVVFDYDKVSSTSYESLTYSLTGALTGAIGGTTAKNMSEIFEVKEKSNVGGGRTVQILVKNQTLLDYEKLFNGTNATYPVTITIADSKNSIAMTTKIAVTDVNEKHSATGGTFYVLEHSASGENVCATMHDDEGNCADYGRIAYFDPDIYNSTFSTMKFKMSSANTSSDADAFIVDYQGYIKTSGNVEFEYDGIGATHTYTFLVTVYDSDFSEDVEVAVNIENIEEPTIQLTTEGKGSIKENAPINFVADKFSKDSLIKDNPSLEAEFDKIGDIYEYEVGTVNGTHGSDIFTVDQDKGNIIVKDNTYLNFEELYPNNSYEVQIVVKGELNDIVINRTVVVMDVNEKPVSRDTTFSVKETIASGASIGKLWATDPDSCSTVAAKACKNGLHTYSFNKLAYSIVDEDDDLPFEINQSTGEITLKQGEKLNFTDKSKYEFKVKISDRSLDPDNPPLSTTATVTINVVDVNRPSEFKVFSELYETEENVEIGTVLTGDKIVVYDEDAADVNKLKITITDKDATTSRDAAKLFEVVQDGNTNSSYLNTFVIKTKSDIDYESLYKSSEKGAIFNVTLTITDAGGETTSADTKIRVLDVNEELYVATPSPFTIAENTAKATTLGIIETTDPDIYNANFGTLYFSLKGDDAAQFDIDAITGELSTISNAKFDYETKSSYKFMAVVTDKKFTKNVNVIVNIADVSEAPKFSNPPTLAVDENVLKGTKVGVVEATDDDCKNTHIATCKQPTYSLTATDIAANDYKSFTIDKNGTITVAKDSVLNFEIKKEYSVRVVATDGSDPTLSSYIDATININDVNDAPTYEYKEYAFEIHENAPKGEFVGSVVANDEDSWSKLTYTISDYVANSKDSEVFKIDASTGKIYLNASIDYETQNTYKFFAKVADNGEDKGFENYSATALVTINVIDAPDPPEIVDDGKKGYDVKENTVDNNSPTGFEIACYEVQDQDKDQVATLVPFVKDAGDTDADRLFDAKLKKNGSKYEVCLTVKNGEKLNYETITHTHNVIISVTDADDQTTEIKKTINIIDVNEMPIISDSLKFSFYEGKAPQIIGKLTSDDIDTSAAFTQNIFTVVGGDSALFGIFDDGKIQTKRKFDYETDKHTFELVVALSDKDSITYPKLTTTATITISLKNMPEIPEITSQKFSVDENSKEGTLIGILKATDPDGDTLTFLLEEESPYVNVSSDGKITVRKGADIDYEKMEKFTILVSVKDQDGLKSDATITINVIDVAESSSSNKVTSSSSSKINSSSANVKSSSSQKTVSSSSKPASSSNKPTSSTSMDSISSSSIQNDKSSSSKPSSSSSASGKSSSSKTSNNDIPDFYVKMIGPFEFEIVMDESVPSIAKKYAVMDIKGQVLSVSELNDKNAYVKVPTRGAYVVKLGLRYRRINIQ